MNTNGWCADTMFAELMDNVLGHISLWYSFIKVQIIHGDPNANICDIPDPEGCTLQTWVFFNLNMPIFIILRAA